MKRKNDAFKQAVVGVFMVTILLLLGYFTIVISGVEIMAGHRKVRLTATFEQVGGLKDHDSVMYRGTKVGAVERVTVASSNLVVEANIDEGVVLRAGYRISVRNLSMLGGNYLLLEEGDGEPLHIPGSVFRGETPTDWMSDVSRIARRLRELTEHLELGGIVTNLEAASASARAIAARVERGEGLAGKLMASDDALYEDIRATAANAREISAQLNRKQLYDDLQAAIGDFRTMCAGIDRASGRIAALGDDVDVKGSVARFNAFMDNASALAENLNAVAVRLRQGEGTLGKLTTDEETYREINGLIRDCRQIIDNYRDTTPIATFTSLIGGAL